MHGRDDSTKEHPALTEKDVFRVLGLDYIREYCFSSLSFDWMLTSFPSSSSSPALGRPLSYAETTDVFACFVLFFPFPIRFFPLSLLMYSILFCPSMLVTRE